MLKHKFLCLLAGATSSQFFSAAFSGTVSAIGSAVGAFTSQAQGPSRTSEMIGDAKQGVFNGFWSKFNPTPSQTGTLLTTVSPSVV